MEGEVSGEEPATGVGHIPSGLFIVCSPDAGREGRWDGFLASWVQQVSFDPLLVSLCIKDGRPCAHHILEGGPFSINTLGNDHKGVLKHFWSGYDQDKNPFSVISHKTGEAGELVLEQSRSTLLCQKVSSSKPGDHHVVIAKVLKSLVTHGDVPSMVHLRKSGLDY